MKLLNDYTTDMDVSDVMVEKFTVEYTQELNSCQSESDFNEPEQKLTLSTDDSGGGKFIHMNLGKSGWSMDIEDIEDFIKILRHFKNIITLDTE